MTTTIKTRWNSKIVYKLVSLKHESLVVRSKEFTIKYSPGKLINPPTGLIFCFDTLEHADAFPILHYQGGIIYESIAYQVEKLDSKSFFTTEGGIKEFWELKNKNKNMMHGYRFVSFSPLGTLGCKYIKLTRKIKEIKPVNQFI